MTHSSQVSGMWGGRFGGGPSQLMQQINASIPVDKRLWREDTAASKAHAAMLRDCGILSAEDAAAILDGLDAVAAECPERLRSRVGDPAACNMTTELGKPEVLLVNKSRP